MKLSEMVGQETLINVVNELDMDNGAVGLGMTLSVMAVKVPASNCRFRSV